MKDLEFISKIEEITKQRREEDPIQREVNRLYNLIYPKEAIEGFYILGYCTAVAHIKNDIYKYLCNEDKEYIDLLVSSTKETNGYKEVLEKLIK